MMNCRVVLVRAGFVNCNDEKLMNSQPSIWQFPQQSISSKHQSDRIPPWILFSGLDQCYSLEQKHGERSVCFIGIYNIYIVGMKYYVALNIRTVMVVRSKLKYWLGAGERQQPKAPLWPTTHCQPPSPISFSTLSLIRPATFPWTPGPLSSPAISTALLAILTISRASSWS